MFKSIALVASVLCLLSVPTIAEDYVAPLTTLAQEKIRPWLGDAVVIKAITEQNAKHATLGQSDIDALDKQWRAETKTSTRPLIAQTLANDLSSFLKQKKAEGQGLFTEIFVMDNKGLNVGQSDVTSDYWQGDEDKWQKTFLVGGDAIFIDKVEKDESTQMLQSQISLAVVDPGTKQVIGAITVGINVDEALK